MIKRKILYLTISQDIIFRLVFLIFTWIIGISSFCQIKSGSYVVNCVYSWLNFIKIFQVLFLEILFIFWLIIIFVKIFLLHLMYCPTIVLSNLMVYMLIYRISNLNRHCSICHHLMIKIIIFIDFILSIFVIQALQFSIVNYESLFKQ